MLTNEALAEEGDGDHVEDEEVEDVLAVLLQVGGYFVVLLEHPVAVALLQFADVETGHPRKKYINFIYLFMYN